MTEIMIKDKADCTSISLDVGAGFPMPRIEERTAAQLKEAYEGTTHVGLRDDDVMMCTFTKCGTTWMFEVLLMMLTKNAELKTTILRETNLEFTPAEILDKTPSPRVLNTHLTYRRLPTDLKNKQTKTVLLLRNPKAVAYSYYKHYTGFKLQEYEGQWKDWLPGYLLGQYQYGKYTNYLRGWQEALDTDVGFPLHVMYYEDMKKYDLLPAEIFGHHFVLHHEHCATSSHFDHFRCCTFEKRKKVGRLLTACKPTRPCSWSKIGAAAEMVEVTGSSTVLMEGQSDVRKFQQNCMEELIGLAEFLGLNLSHDLLQDIMKNTSFENMQAKKFAPNIIEAYFKNGFRFFRKGQIADWKNGFTVQQDEMFDEIWKKESKGLTFKFQYE